MDRIGRYKIVRELGRGAMGVVYHAIDPNIGRPVAIKTIQLGGRKPEEQERLRERLFREARSAGTLSHPGIVTIYDVEQQGDLAYIAMEYVDGHTLDQLLAPDEAPQPEQIFSILGQTAAALDYAHEKGIIHRDIKPANIMIASGGAVKIADFGIAKITASEQFTMTGSIVGTPHYMSPEQVQGEPVDGRSDQFSLAVIAFEMLTGDKPYTGEHLTTVVYKIVAEQPPQPHRLNPSLSAGIDTVLVKALAKKPDARYRSCQEFVDALEKACAASRGWKPMPRGGGANEPTAIDAGVPQQSLPPAYRARHGETTLTADRPRKRKSGFLVYLLAVLVVAGLLALIGWQADPTMPRKMQGLSQRIQAALGLAAPAPQPKQQQSAAPPAQAGPAPPQPQPLSEQKQAREQQPPPVAAAEEKPSPMPPAEKSAEAPPARASDADGRPALPSKPQPVSIISSPAGATATLDNRPDAACATPCTLDAAPGRHTIAITMPGYQVEHREVTVRDGPVEIPAVALRVPTGTLMLITVPSGAAISVNGRKLPQITPATIPLSPGNYVITVEKDGKQATDSVEIRNGAMSLLRIVLEH
ncbi:MAG: protein kinase [Acidobacteriia bacterium]|nr:protein kinase [Terriglobia bacterium]